MCAPQVLATLCICRFRFRGRGSMGLMLVMSGQIGRGPDEKWALDVIPRPVTQREVGRRFLCKEEIVLNDFSPLASCRKRMENNCLYLHDFRTPITCRGYRGLRIIPRITFKTKVTTRFSKYLVVVFFHFLFFS